MGSDQVKCLKKMNKLAKNGLFLALEGHFWPLNRVTVGRLPDRDAQARKHPSKWPSNVEKPLFLRVLYIKTYCYLGPTPFRTSHLEWHPKNLYVALYFDMGWFGLVAFSAVCLVALFRAWRRASSGEMFGAATMSAIVGFLVLGSTGTLLDVPQLMTLMLLVSITAMWRPQIIEATPEPHTTRVRRRRRRDVTFEPP